MEFPDTIEELEKLISEQNVDDILVRDGRYCNANIGCRRADSTE